AEHNFALARAAVDEMLTEVGSRELRDVPQMEPVRQRLLQKALEFYQQFLEAKSDDPAVRLEAGLAYWRVGKIHGLLGQPHQAREAFGEAVVLLTGLAEEFPDRALYREELANVHDTRGLHLRPGDAAEAEKAHRAALALRERLAADFPDNSSYRQLVAHS